MGTLSPPIPSSFSKQVAAPTTPLHAITTVPSNISRPTISSNVAFTKHEPVFSAISSPSIPNATVTTQSFVGPDPSTSTSTLTLTTTSAFEISPEPIFTVSQPVVSSPNTTIAAPIVTSVPIQPIVTSAPIQATTASTTSSFLSLAKTETSETTPASAATITTFSFKPSVSHSQPSSLATNVANTDAMATATVPSTFSFKPPSSAQTVVTAMPVTTSSVSMPAFSFKPPAAQISAPGFGGFGAASTSIIPTPSRNIGYLFVIIPKYIVLVPTSMLEWKMILQQQTHLAHLGV
jgi:hypothetical protein